VQAGLDALLAATYPEWPPHPAIVRPVVAAGERREVGGFTVEFFAVAHRVPTLAVRVSHGGRTLAFSADSLPCAALVACARGANLFILRRDLLATRSAPCATASAGRNTRAA